MKKRHNINDYELKHLKQQSLELSNLIDYVGVIESYYILDSFTALCNSIIYQSISFLAATAIWKRFSLLFDDITPTNILSKTQLEIKNIGLSTNKAEYIQNIAKAFINNEINTNFNGQSDSEVRKELQKIRGIGPWTAEMFLIFSLNRKNVLSYGDIAIRRGLEKIYNIDHDITKKEFKVYQELFHPYNTVASFYLWEITLRKLFKENL